MISNRLPITVIAASLATVFIVGGIFLLVQKDTFIVRRKASQYQASNNNQDLLKESDIWYLPPWDCSSTSEILQTQHGMGIKSNYQININEKLEEFNQGYIQCCCTT